MNILITGAGRGLGYHLTKLAVERGHMVLACARDVSDISIDLLTLATLHGDMVYIEPMNVTNEAEVANLASKLQKDSVKLDCIINNAGILLGREHKLATLPMAFMKTTFEVNLFGPMYMVKYMGPLMSEHSGSFVINISSEAGSVALAYGGDYPYAMSKCGLNMFSKMLASELHPRGIRVLAVHPGWIRTDMGGDKAPLDAEISAQGILDLVEQKTVVSEELFFVDHTGRSMPL